MILKAVALGAAIAPGHAAAQEGREIEFTLNGTVLYDSNIARASRAVAELRGIEREDVRFTPSADFRVSLPTGRHLFFIDATAAYDFHAVNERLDRERLRATSGLESRFARCITRFEGSIARRRVELDDLLIEPVESTETVRAVTGAIRCPREAGLYPALSGSHSESENSLAVRAEADLRITTYRGSLLYTRPTLGEVEVTARYRRADYPNRDVQLPSGRLESDGFRVLELGAVYSRALGSLVQGTAGAFYTDVEGVARGGSFSGLTYNVALQFNPYARLRPRLQASRSVEGPNRVGVLYQIEQRLRGDLEYRVGPNTSAVIGAQRRKRRFELAPTSVPLLVNNEKTDTYFAELNAKIHPRIAVAIDAQRESRDTGVPLFDYSSTRLGLTARLTF